MKKITSIKDLGKFKAEQTAFWIVLRPVDEPQRNQLDSERWMVGEHPKVYFDRKIMSPLWKTKRRIPKMHAEDFMIITSLVTQRLVIERFVIKEIFRSNHTGEFSYKNEVGELMPESFLFARRSEAVKESLRLQQLIVEWTNHIDGS